MVHQDILFFPQLSVLENITLGCERAVGYGEAQKKGGKSSRLAAIFGTGHAKEMAVRIQDSLGLNLDLDRQAKELPFAQRQQIELVRLLYRGAEILILDEPTSLLSPGETKRLLDLMESMREGGRTVLFISHRLGEVFSISDRITVLRKGCVAATLDAGATCVEEIAGLMVGGRLAPDADRAGALTGLPRRSTDADAAVLELRSVGVGPAGTEPGLRDISISVEKGEIFGIGGIVGNGQRSFARILAGKTRPDSGSILFEGADITRLGIEKRLGKNIRWLQESPAEEALLPGRPLWENFLLGRQREEEFAKAGLIRKDGVVRFSMEQISLANIAASGPFESVSGLSGGNRQKVALARVLIGPPRLAILEQPCRGLDLLAAGSIRDRIFRLSRAEQVSFIVISYDFDELLFLCDRIAVIYRGEIVGIAERATVSRELLGRWAAGVKD
jgi:simple sugar transport system ATP-binding protein